MPRLARRRTRELRRHGGVWLPLLLAAVCWMPHMPGAPGDGEVATHRVRQGDTIPRLCWQYKVRAEAIHAANPGVVDPLPVGRKLTIPLGHYELPAAVHAPGPAARPTPAPSLLSAPRPGKSPPSVVPTTRLPPQAPEAPTPARRPVTLFSAEMSRP